MIMPKFNKQVLTYLFIVLQSTFFTVATSAQEKSDSLYYERDIDVTYGRKLPLANSTAAISFVGGNKLIPSVTSLSNALSGKIAGLTTMLNSGEPGKDGADLYIRGRGSYNNNQLLVYVDGFQSSYDYILPSEIESISVFKDAAALSQFGIEGANGVLWITTKKGMESPVKISFQSKTMIQQPTRRMSFLNSYDYASLYNEANSNDRGAWMPVYSDVDMAKYKDGSDPVLYPDVNWYDEVVKQGAPYYDATLSFRGGNSVVKYAVMLGYQTSDMFYKNNYPISDKMKEIGQFTKYNFRANTDIQINKVFSASVNLGGMVGNYTRPSYIISTLWNNLAAYPSNIYPVKNPNGIWGGNAVYTDNPVASVSATGTNTNQERFIQANIKLKQDMSFLIKGLSLNEAVSFSDYFYGRYNKVVSDYIRNQPYLDEQGEIAYSSYGTNGDIAISDGVSDVWERINYFVSADYETRVGDNDFGARVAFNQNSYIVDGRNAPYFKQGISGYLRYDLKQKYLMEFSYSYSGSENFMRGHRFGFFPALSGAWIVSKENLMQNLNWVDFLKLKVSAGIVGNDRIGSRFLYQSYFAGGSAYTYILGSTGQTTQATLAESIVGNPYITWEKSHKFNMGIDLLAMKKFNVVLDLFYDKRTDIISQKNATVPDVYGNILPYENVGEVSNKGFELELSYSDRIGKLAYQLKSIYSVAHNIIDYQEEPIRSEPYLYRTGHPVGQPFGFEYIGFYQLEDFDSNGNLTEGIAIPSYPVQPGDLKYVDKNNDGFINEDDVIAIGYSVIPEITYSFEADVKYKMFDLNLFFQGAANRSVYLNGVYAWAFVNNTGAPEMAKGRWAYYPEQGIDTRAIATYPRLSTENNGNNYTLSSFWQKNGNYLRLKSTELGFTLPEQTCKNLGVENIRFIIGGTNLLTFDHIKYYDPEVIGGYPLAKNYYLGINVNF